MKRNWTYEKALLTLRGNVVVDMFRKQIVAPHGLNGLKQCSAADYLRKYHHYTYITG